MSTDVWQGLRRRVAGFAALLAGIGAVIVIVNSSTLKGVVVGAPLMAACGFGLAALVASEKPDEIERMWVALALVLFAAVAVAAFALLGG